MLSFIADNLGTILVLLILCALVCLAVWKIVSDRRNGRSSCGSGCAGCPMSGSCRKETKRE